MGDGIQRKFALMVNGDPQEERYFQNVDRAIKTLKSEDPDYQIAVASARQPSSPVTSYLTPSESNLKNLIAGFKDKIDDDDLLVVYITGHGGLGKGEGCAELPDGCLSNARLRDELKALPYGRRIIVMDNSYSGAAVALFTDAKTEIATAGSPGEEVQYQNFAPYFWDEKAPDFDDDGVVTTAERFRNAIKQGQPSTYSNYFSLLPAISLSGKEKKKTFKPEILQVTNSEQLKNALGQLEPDQFALVMFSEGRGEPGHELPTLQRLAKEYGDQFRMIHAEKGKGSAEDWPEYGIYDYPTLAFINSRGGNLIVATEYHNDPKEYLKKLTVLALPEKQKIAMMLPVLDLPKEQKIAMTLKIEKDSPFMQALEQWLKKSHYPQYPPTLEEKLPFSTPPVDKVYFIIPYLTGFLKDPSPFVRSRAAFALGHLESHGKPALLQLIPLLEDPDPRARAEAIHAILQIDRYGDRPFFNLPLSHLKYFKKKIAQLHQSKDPVVRLIAGQSSVLILGYDPVEKDHPSKKVSSYLRLLKEPELKKYQFYILAEMLQTIATYQDYFDQKKIEGIIKTIAEEGRKNPSIAKSLTDQLMVGMNMRVSKKTCIVMMKILAKIGNGSSEIVDSLRGAQSIAESELQNQLQSLLTHLDNVNLKGNYLGLAATPGASGNLQLGVQASYSRRWNRLWELRTNTALAYVSNPKIPVSTDYRVDLSAGPVFHWPSTSRGTRFDPYLSSEVGLFHQLKEKSLGLSSAAGWGLQYHFSDRLLLEGGVQMVLDIPISGKPKLGVRIPLGVQYRF